MTFFLHEKYLSLTENNQFAGIATIASRGTLVAILLENRRNEAK